LKNYDLGVGADPCGRPDENRTSGQGQALPLQVPATIIVNHLIIKTCTEHNRSIIVQNTNFIKK